jgi:hypothetical protein
VRILAVAIALLVIAGPVSSDRAPEEAAPTPIPVRTVPGTILTSSSTTSGLALRETAGLDSFVLYGGPDHPSEGKFQMADGSTPDWGGGNGLPGGYGGGPNAWKPVDLTQRPTYWHVDTFNAENLNGNGAGNRAMWCGLSAGEPETEYWATPPGYGNSWEDILIYESPPVSNPTAGQVVGLDFFFNYDTETGFDFLYVEFERDGAWVEACVIDGSNKDTSNAFPPPGVQFSAVQTRPIEYFGNDYGGDYGDQIRLRIRFQSDGAWSDEDGRWSTHGGAAQVDDISLTTSHGTLAEDFESEGPYLFEPFVRPFAGDFADVYTWLSDSDPCRVHFSPVLGFIDYGQQVRNGPGHTGATSTGGSISPGVSYGIEGNYVVNYNGGLSFGEAALWNQVWSPEISWDLPGSEDDDPAIVGAFFRLSMFADMPMINGISWVWHVRSALPGEQYSSWQDRDSGFHPIATSTWIRIERDVSDLIQTGADRVQLGLGCFDWADVFGFPGTAATPSPVYDDVSFYKYRVAGPNLLTHDTNLAQDGFPTNGSVDVSSEASRDALDVPFDMARDVNIGDRFNVPGDSVIVDVRSMIVGTTTASLDLVWALDTNPLFEDAIRAAPSRGVDHAVVTGPAGTIWSGEVTGSQSTTSSGAEIEGRYFFDLPDVNFLYPGDVLHYYIRAVDSDGRTSTLPSDLTGFGSFGTGSIYDRKFVVRALPSIRDAAGAQPGVLVINGARQPVGEDEFTSSFSQLGYHEGVDYDTYTVRAAISGVSNGIGSAGAHGANAQQLDAYRHLFCFMGDRSSYLLSNGSNTDSNDKSNDIAAIEQWFALDGVRNSAWFGDNIGAGLVNGSSESLAFLNAQLGVLFVDDSVHDAIGDQNAPRIVPSPYGATWFSGEFVAYGGCYELPRFDQIGPTGGSLPGHQFLDVAGQPITTPDYGVASVINPVPFSTRITFPISLSRIYNVAGRTTGPGARTLLFGEVLGLFNAGTGSGPPTAVPERRVVDLSATPNPFNPSTTISFALPHDGHVELTVYDLAGRRIKVLVSAHVRAGEHETQWHGRDEAGKQVASGVYLYQLRAGEFVETRRMVLVK